MPTGDPLNVSASALSAQRARMNVIAENLANANTTKTAAGGPYRRRVVTLESETPPFAAVLAGASSSGGVRVAGVTEVGSSRLAYLPGHPEANKDGYVEMPDVNPIVEMTDLMAATRAYEANVTAIQAFKSMAQKALELGR